MIAGGILHCIEALRFSCRVSYRAVLAGEWQLIFDELLGETGMSRFSVRTVLEFRFS